MADTTADDQFERYFAEKLWELVPSIYRHEDGIAERPGAYRALIELVAEQAALLRRSHDRLWEDAFIDGCDDWAVPYIGDLVAARPLSALVPRGRRIDVAKTIYYRRRKGTPRILEELIADITGWDGKVVEGFRGLARTVHRLDPAPADRLDPVRGTADLRRPRLAEHAGTAWDPFAHTADLRRSRGARGRWNIPVLAFHVFRLAAYRLQGVRPRARTGDATFTFDPSGRDTWLFMPRHRGAGASNAAHPADRLQGWDAWESAMPWQVPAPMSCRVLGHAEYVVDEELRTVLASDPANASAVAALATIIGRRFDSEAALRRHLVRLQEPQLLATANWDTIRDAALVPDCGKAALWGDAVAVSPSGSAIPQHRASSGSLAAFGAPLVELDVLVDPQLGRFELAAPAAQPGRARVSYVYGFGGDVGAGGYDRRHHLVDVPDRVVAPAPATGGAIVAADFRRAPITNRIVGVTEVPDSATYTPQVDPDDVEELAVQAANFERPYVLLVDDWVFTAAVGLEATLALDGLWVGGRAGEAIILRGNWSRVAIRSCTLDPGGVDVDGASLTPVRLVVEGSIDLIELDRAIAPSIATAGSGMIDRIVARDSILDARLAGGSAIALPDGEVELRRVTALGSLDDGDGDGVIDVATIDAERLDASDCLILGRVDVTDTQAGCFRFSAAAPDSRLPHPYRNLEWAGGPVFVSSRFGDPAYAWLAEYAPEAIRRGAEDGLEMGVWNDRKNPIKEDSLLRKAEEYMPFGLVPVFIRET